MEIGRSLDRFKSFREQRQCSCQLRPCVLRSVAWEIRGRGTGRYMNQPDNIIGRHLTIVIELHLSCHNLWLLVQQHSYSSSLLRLSISLIPLHKHYRPDIIMSSLENIIYRCNHQHTTKHCRRPIPMRRRRLLAIELIRAPLPGQTYIFSAVTGFVNGHKYQNSIGIVKTRLTILSGRPYRPSDQRREGSG